MDWNLPLKGLPPRLAKPVVMIPDRQLDDPLETEGIRQYFGGARRVTNIPTNYGPWRFIPDLKTNQQSRPSHGDPLGTLQRFTSEGGSRGPSFWHDLSRGPKGTVDIGTSFFTGRPLGRSPAENPKQGIDTMVNAYMDLSNVVKLIRPGRVHFLAGDQSLTPAYSRFFPQMARKLGAKDWQHGKYSYDLYFPDPMIYGRW